MKHDGKRTYAYKFEGYWKDVGTVKSYWEANMDLLSEDNALDLYDASWKIYTKNKHLPPQYIGSEASVVNSMVNEGCNVEGSIENSILFNEILIKKGAKVFNSVILSGVTISEDCEIHNAVIMEDVTVKPGTVIGKPDSEFVYLVSKNKIIESE